MILAGSEGRFCQFSSYWGYGLAAQHFKSGLKFKDIVTFVEVVSQSSTGEGIFLFQSLV